LETSPPWKRQLSDTTYRFKKTLRLGALEELFGKAAEKDRFATVNPFCGGLAVCALQTKPIGPLEFGQRQTFGRIFFTCPRQGMRKNDFSQTLTTFTTTRGIHYNVKVNAHRSRAPVVPTLCLTAGERSKGFRRNEGDSRKSRADRAPIVFGRFAAARLSSGKVHKRLGLYSTQWGAWITPSWEQEANAKSAKRNCRAGV
jgi:hypothetical protein